MQGDGRTEAAVMDVMNKWRASYAARDIDAIMALYAPDTDVVLIGTGANERCVGPTEIRALHELEWSQSEAGSIELGWHAVSAAASMACVAMEVTVHVRVEGQEMHLPARITAVLEQREDGQAWPTLPAAAIEENKAIARRFNQDVWTGGNSDAVDEMVAPDLVWHNAGIFGVQAFKDNLTAFRADFPDLRNVTEDLVAEGDKVVARMTIQGTWARTGKQATWTAIGILRIVDGKIVEMWTDEDRLGRVQQLGFELVRRQGERQQ
jgi:predicted ester cyclase/ketosteroid isomerase-like protein